MLNWVMRFFTHNNISGKQAAKAVIAFACLLCFALVILLSSTHISSHAEADICHTTEHSHKNVEDGGCSVCSHLHKVEISIKPFGAADGISFMLLGMIAVSAFTYHNVTKTPVKMRVRMNT
jgi:hypothetical protein